MANVPENELFSAYLDGQLTAEEKVQVEQLLSTNPAARQLMDELRALTSSLQTLPKYKVEEDLALSQRVLRLAERQMLSEPAVPEGEGDQFESERAPRPSLWQRVLRPRTLAWSATAVAVALLLMIMESGRLPQQDEDIVAVRTEPSSDQSTSGPVIQAAKEPGETAPGRTEKAAPHVPLNQATSRPAPVAQAATEKTPAGKADRSGETPVIRCTIRSQTVYETTFAQILTGQQIAGPEKVVKAKDRIYFEIELTTAQYRAVVAELKSRSEEFPTVSAPSLPDVAPPGPEPATDGASARETEPKHRVRFALHVVKPVTKSSAEKSEPAAKSLEAADADR